MPLNPYHGAVLRVSRALPVVALVAIAAGCGGSHSTAPTTTTQPVNTVPKPTQQLIVGKFPSQLAGSLTYNVNRTQGKLNKPGSWKRKYTVTLDNVLLRLAAVQGKGAKQKARYNLVSADESFTGSEDLTNSKCKTSHIVWNGTGTHPTGTVEVFGPKFDSEVGFVFLVPQRGTVTTRPCTAKSGGSPGTVSRTARIEGNANLRLAATKSAADRFSIGIQIESSTAGTGTGGGYTINGSLAPPATGSPVRLCRLQGDKLSCPA
jgi:hypothetical protein